MDNAILEGKNVAELFTERDQLERDVMQESAFHRGLECLRSLQVPLERLKLLLDLASPLANIEPTGTAVVGLVKGVTAVRFFKASCAFTTRSGLTYIVMERIKGDIIGRGWVRRSEDSMKKLLLQLAEKVSEMRDVQPLEGTRIASVDGRSLFDFRVPGPSLRFGPFDSIQDFHRHLRRGMEFDSRLDLEVQELIKQQSKFWPLVFTHGDLSSLNILVRGDDLVGIIDWETAGWYPSYCEYTSAHQVNPQNSFWADEIDKFLQSMPEELAMERIRQKYFGDV